MKPELTCKGLQFYPIPKIDVAKAAFGLDADQYFNRNSLPDVPENYESIISSLFFCGGDLPEMQNEVDRSLAAAFIRGLLASFAPPHEAKVATAAYALWVWCEGDIE